MSSKNRIDMSLDEIIKLNRQKIKQEKKEVKPSAAATPGRAQDGKHKAATSGGTTSASSKTKYRVPNKLRKYATQNRKVTGPKGRAQQRRKLTTSKGQQVANKARQTLRQSIVQRQRDRKEQILNRYRGINNAPATSQTSRTNTPAATSRVEQVTTAAGRGRKLKRPGFGVMQADILEQQQRKEQLGRQTIKSEIEWSITGQRQTNIKRRWHRQSERAQRNGGAVIESSPAIYAVEATMTGQRKENVKRRYQRQKERATVAGTAVVQPGHVLTVSVKNDMVSASSSRTNQSVANRMLQHTLQQPMRERQRAQRNARGRSRGRPKGSGVGGQVRMLTNTIHNLQEQVASLRGGGSRQSQVQRGRKRGVNSGPSRRGGTSGGRQNTTRSKQHVQHVQQNQHVQPSRRVLW